MEKLVTKKACAELLGVSTRTVERQVRKGMPVVRVGERMRFDMVDVMNWLRSKNND